ncbi:cytochrome-c peroxidase [Methylobacterium frigidaeris]|uniref:Cytochrome c551 peroxidase n=1 Tax=Methylobacterium frigidaeris TaxID=2038277 RepID=A0AA37HI79_9HYPH|nr:cytochrome c peroxidase [Methylobacterium frigidaeris]GJD66455.1 Cytochrome c551 peroxidase [Methylobacterium frigidaeris]
MALRRPAGLLVAPLVAVLLGSVPTIPAPLAEPVPRPWPAGGPSSAEAIEALSIVTPVPGTLGTDPSRAAIGRRLFTDTRLSRGGDRACITCHDITTNGASAAARDLATDGTPVPRNTPTVFNAALSFRLGWAGDILSLRDQDEKALTEPEFLGGSWPRILAVIRADPALAGPFRAAYGREVDREAVIDAISQFERSLLTPDSRFDRWLRGDAHAITESERAGYDLFRGIGCAACHQGVNVGANLFEKVGIFVAIPNKSGEVLRVPSLRNVAVTAPYFDDGSVATLPEAVRMMARAQLGREMTPAQVAAIVAFLGTLTGSYDGRPLTAPEAPAAPGEGRRP